MDHLFLASLKMEEQRLRAELQAVPAFRKLEAVGGLLRIYAGAAGDEASLLARVLNPPAAEAPREAAAPPGDFLSALRAEEAGLISELRASPTLRRLNAIMKTAALYEGAAAVPASDPNAAGPPGALRYIESLEKQERPVDVGEQAVASVRTSLARESVPEPDSTGQGRVASVRAAILSAALGKTAVERA